MAARSRSFPLPMDRIEAVSPEWLETNLAERWLRVLDVRTDPDARDEGSGARLRPAGNVELRSLGHLGGPDGWQPSRERHPRRQGPPAVYLRGHVPGSIALDVRLQLFDDDGELVTAPELAMAMSSIGVGDEHTVVLVDEGRPNAALAAAWALVRFGHERVYVLDGGFARWLAEGGHVTREIVRHPLASFTARVNP